MLFFSSVVLQIARMLTDIWTAKYLNVTMFTTEATGAIGFCHYNKIETRALAETEIRYVQGGSHAQCVLPQPDLKV
jgi:hypothetical protein